MNRFGKRQNRAINEINEEDVAKELLNKKTEMALYKDIEAKKQQQTRPVMTRNEYKKAEESMSSALDMLRKERGQKTIEQEEIEYSFQEQLQEYEELEDMSDVTSKNFYEDLNPSVQMVKDALKEDETDQNTGKVIFPFKAPAKKRTKKKSKKEEKQESQEKSLSHTSKQKKVEVEQEDKKSKKSKKAKKKKDKKKDKKKKEPRIKLTPVTKAIIAMVILGFALMGAYAYKIYVYDPQNVVTEAQQESYDKLIAYADEYDMMSDSEKLELLNMEDDYNSLLSKQQSAINSYFKDENHVGKTYKALIKELKALQESLSDETGAEYQSLKTFLEGWPNYEDSQKREIVNYKSIYDALNTTLQKKIDEIARTNCSKSFVSLYQEYHDVILSENKVQIEANKEQIAQLEEQLATEQSSLDELNTYAESLNSELENAKNNNEDTTSIQSQIDSNNQAIEQQQQKVDEIQKQIDELKEQNQELANV